MLSRNTEKNTISHSRIFYDPLKGYSITYMDENGEKQCIRSSSAALSLAKFVKEIKEALKLEKAVPNSKFAAKFKPTITPVNSGSDLPGYAPPMDQ